MTIIPEQPDYRAAISRITTLAFGRPSEARLIEELRLGSTFIPGLSLVALNDHEPIGHILLSAVQIKGADGVATPSLALAPMSVLPEHQKKGVGTALVRAALERAGNSGHGSVIVLGHPEYYPRFGFRPASEWGIRAPFAASDGAFMAMELHAGALHGVGGVVGYPDVFGSAT